LVTRAAASAIHSTLTSRIVSYRPYTCLHLHVTKTKF